MKLRVFQAGKGDCLLITADDGKRVLVDGGMRADYREHVAPYLARLRQRDIALDLVYVSHIDRDHISGVLQLMDDLVAWRVFDYQRGTGNHDYPEPENARPPEIRDLWHNAFGELVSENDGAIEGRLDASASLLASADDQPTRSLAAAHRELATSIAEGIELSRRASPRQLGIPVNRQFKGKLALVGKDVKAIRLGGLKLTVIGPFTRDLRKLRAEWNTWLRENQEQLERLRRQMEQDVRRLGASDFDRLRRAIGLASAALGDRNKVTVPNLASLMLLVEENGRQVLLTGDGHADDVLAGLENAGLLDPELGLHVDVLKVQHHGSEHNLTPEFARQITANRYLFCGNGEHRNPDSRVVQAIIDSRLGPALGRSTNPSAKRRFSLQFNSSAHATDGHERQHMQEIESLVRGAVVAGGNRMSCTFLKSSSFEIRLS
ncbi:MAG: MBL fold metallo-hydrolase [Gaiellaceae bacterium]